MIEPLKNSGDLKQTGYFLIYPVDQGIEQGPLQAFSNLNDSFDPFYHIKLAVEIKASAYACPLGAMECVASAYHDRIPLILKLNCGNKLYKHEPHQAFIGNVEDALRLKCKGIGLTIYPGSDFCLEMIEKASDYIRQAHKKGLFVVVWSYARGGKILNNLQDAFDVVCYGAQIAAQMGADMIKVKIPSQDVMDPSLSHFSKFPLVSRIEYVMKSALGKPVVFSGGNCKDTAHVLEEVKAIKNGQGSGSIIGRNLFQRSRVEAIELAKNIMSIYKNK